MHRDGKPGVHDRLVGIVVLDEGDPARAGAIGDERIVVLREVGGRRQGVRRLPLEVAVHVIDVVPGGGLAHQVRPLADDGGEAGHVVVALGRVLAGGAKPMMALPLLGHLPYFRDWSHSLLVGRPVRARDGVVGSVRSHHRDGVRLDVIFPHFLGLLGGEDVVEVALALGRDQLAHTALGREDSRFREFGYGGVPQGLLRGEVGADILQRLALRVGEDVELEVRAAGLLLDELAHEVHPPRDVRVRVDVEAVGDRRRQAREVVLPFAEEARAGRSERETVFAGEIALDRERRTLRHRRVDEIDHGRGGRVARCGGVRVRNRHRRGVPDFWKPQRRLREHLRHLHRRHAVRRRPDGYPVPRDRRFDVLEIRRRGVLDLDAVHPADVCADDELVVAERRTVEALLHRVGVERHRRAVAPRPRRALAIHVHDVQVVRERPERRIGVVARLRTVELADGAGNDHAVSGDDGVGEGRVGERRRDHAVRLHRALPVLRILREDDRLRGFLCVEVVAHRPYDVVAVELQEGVLLVRVPTDRLPVVLIVDRRLDARIGAESAVEFAGTAAPGHGEPVRQELVAVAGAVRGHSLRVVARRGFEVGLGEEEPNGVRGIRPGLVDAADRDVVKRDAACGAFSASRAKRELGPLAGPFGRQREADFFPAVERNAEGVLQDAVKRASEHEVRIGDPDERNGEGGAVRGHGSDAAGRHVGRKVGGIDLESDEVRDAGERNRAAHLGVGILVDERERATAEGLHRGVGRAALR